METETLDPNDTASTADSNSGITHTSGVFDKRGSPTPIILPINSIPDTHINE